MVNHEPRPGNEHRALMRRTRNERRRGPHEFKLNQSSRGCYGPPSHAREDARRVRQQLARGA